VSRAVVAASVACALGAALPGIAGALVLPQLTAGPEFPVRATSAHERWADTFGDIVVWADNRNTATTGWDIFMKDLSTGIESPVCLAPNDQYSPAIFGNIVAWEDARGGWQAYDIYAKDLLTGVEFPVCTAANMQHNVAIFGDHIVWKDWRNDNGSYTDADIYMHDLATGVTSPVCVASGNQTNPDIYGDVVVWSDARLGALSTDVYMADLAVGTEARVTSAADQQNYPRIYDETVVWQDSRAPVHATWAHDLQSGLEWQVSMTSGGQYGPRIFGETVVWTRAVPPLTGPTDIYATDLTTGIDTVVAAQVQDEQVATVYGHLIAWEHFSSTSDHDIYAARTEGPTTRFDALEGATRYDTAAAASADAYRSLVPWDPEGYRTVVVATGRNWPDALGASAFAGVLDAPVMITQTDYVPKAVKDEIVRLGATRAIIVGGDDVVAPAVETELQDMGMKVVERVEGPTRYETAEEVARRVAAVRGPRYDGVAFLATGRAFPDALAAAPIATAKGWPIFLAGPAGITDSTWQAMADIGVSKVHILGGPGAVSMEVEQALAVRFGGANLTRQMGDTRYETAAAVASFGVDKVGLQWDTLAVATGENFPDALAGGAVQARTRSVLLLTRGDELPKAAADVMAAKRDSIATLRYLGGTDVVSTAVRGRIAGVLH